MGFNFSILKKKTCFKENKVQVKEIKAHIKK